MKKFLTLLAMTFSLAGCGSETVSSAHPPIIFETTQGNITVELTDDLTPITSSNFRKLVREGFYDGLTFHRFVDGFVIQGGDPEGTGMGGSADKIYLEIPCTDGETIVGEVTNCTPALPHEDGVIAMARSASPNSASSQFYFTLGAQPSLDGKYAVFGRVTSGLDTVRKLRQGDIMNKVYEQTE